MKDRLIIAKGKDADGTLHYIIPCKKCANKNKVYHMLWCAFPCLKCKVQIPNPKHDCAGQEECYYENTESDYEVDGPYGCPCCRPDKSGTSETKQKYSNDPYIFYTEVGDKEIRDSSGYVLRRYSNIPKKIKFSHSAVNDYNQHLCGGWEVYPYKQFEELDRVIAGLKPLGVCYSNNLVQVKKKVKKLSKKGFLATYIKHPEIEGEYIITASVSGTLGDYFDMDTLANDYENYEMDSEEIIQYKDREFLEFHYDTEMMDKHPIEIIGLIFGYPIENTMVMTREFEYADFNIFIRNETSDEKASNSFIFYTPSGHKQVRNADGFVLMTYPNIPKDIRFKHKMVNDYNQHLYGWSVFPPKKFKELDRVSIGLKPLGVCYSDNLSEVIEKTIELSTKGLLVTYKERKLINDKTDYVIIVSVNGKLGDYFDMDILAEDYERYGINSDNIRTYENVSFADFHNGIHDDSHPMEIIDLVRGHPIENTISLILRDM